jgi:hypothetical protein
MSVNDQNPFGGKNPHGMYVPLTDVELEVLARLATAGDFILEIKDWGRVADFVLGKYNERTWDGRSLVVFGDKRISFYFTMVFNAPEVPQPNWYFDVVVWARGFKLFEKRMPTEMGGKPIMIGKDLVLNWAFDVALDCIDPSIIKAVKPKTIGLTTRHGNMHLDTHHQRLLAQLRLGEATVRAVSDAEAVEATRRMKRITR